MKPSMKPMKLKALAAAVALAASGAANAVYTDSASNVYLTGASAIRNNVAYSIKTLCTDAGGSLTVFKNGASTSSLANQMAYVCSAPMASTAVTTVIHTVTGGSLNSILGMSDDVDKQQVPVSLTSGCLAPVAGTGALAGFSVRASCALEGAPAPSDGGFSDVEYGPVVEQVNGLTSAVDGFTLGDVSQGFTGVAQVFGLAVSDKMYKDLQAAQGLIAAGCVSGDPLPACQPSLNRADVVSLINNNEFTPHKAGAEALGLTAGAAVEYARRVTTSGTQSSAQILFLGKGCLTGDNAGQFVVIGDEISPTPPVPAVRTKSYSTTYKVSANSGTGDVITRLGAAGTTISTPVFDLATGTYPTVSYAVPDYVFGWVSGENRAPVGAGWKFIKLNGVSFSDGTATGLNKINAVEGDYEFFVETATYKGPAAKTDADEGALLDAIAGKMATPAGAGGPETPGMFIIPDNGVYDHATHPTEVSIYQRGGGSPNSCAPVARP